ncbi:MAG: DUF1059 domain-containing protein [Actinomycetota bacterium]
MPEIRCVDLGATCTFPIRGGSKEDVLRKWTEHLQKKHGVKVPTQTILNFAESNIR